MTVNCKIVVNLYSGILNPSFDLNSELCKELAGIIRSKKAKSNTTFNENMVPFVFFYVVFADGNNNEIYEIIFNTIRINGVQYSDDKFEAYNFIMKAMPTNIRAQYLKTRERIKKRPGAPFPNLE